MKAILTVIGSIINVVGWFVKPSKKKKMKHDQRLANAIRKGDGRKVAQEFKRRRKYT